MASFSAWFELTGAGEFILSTACSGVRVFTAGLTAPVGGVPELGRGETCVVAVAGEVLTVTVTIVVGATAGEVAGKFARLEGEGEESAASWEGTLEIEVGVKSPQAARNSTDVMSNKTKILEIFLGS